MIEALLFLLVALLVVALGLLFLLWQRRVSVDFSPATVRLEAIEKNQERAERAFREELARSREEDANQSRELRGEISGAIKNFNDSVLQQLAEMARLQQQQLEAFATQLRNLGEKTGQRLDQAREDAAGQARQHRDDTALALKSFNDSTVRSVTDMATLQRGQLENFSAQLTRLTETNATKLEELKLTVENKLAQLQADNATKLEEMRRTVDEKLQGTLEKRLGESFKLVSDRLEQVHKGLGEMQTLASGVGDLKKVLTNVKTRGTWGEMQLGNLLEQILTPEQFAKNVATVLWSTSSNRLFWGAGALTRLPPQRLHARYS